MTTLSDILSDPAAMTALSERMGADAHESALAVVRSAADDLADARGQLVAVIALARRLGCTLREIGEAAEMSPQTIANMLKGA